MDFILLIVWVVLGTSLFALLNKIVNITYFGFSAIFGAWVGCMAAIAIVFYFAANFVGWLVALIIGFFTTYYKWIMGAVVTFVILGLLGGKSDKKSEGIKETNF